MRIKLLFCQAFPHFRVLAVHPLQLPLLISPHLLSSHLPLCPLLSHLLHSPIRLRPPLVYHLLSIFRVHLSLPLLPHLLIIQMPLKSSPRILQSLVPLRSYHKAAPFRHSPKLSPGPVLLQSARHLLLHTSPLRLPQLASHLPSFPPNPFVIIPILLHLLRLSLNLIFLLRSPFLYLRAPSTNSRPVGIRPFIRVQLHPLPNLQLPHCSTLLVALLM